MTLTEFLVKLAQSGGEWKVDHDGCIRCRGRCPLEHVAGARGVDVAMSVLGLDSSDVLAIAGAADALNYRDLTYSPVLRRELLALTVGRVQ